MGEVPWWYGYVQAAKYLGVAPWELLHQADFWTDAALISMNAEASAREQIERRERRRAG